LGQAVRTEAFFACVLKVIGNRLKLSVRVINNPVSIKDEEWYTSKRMLDEYVGDFVVGSEVIERYGWVGQKGQNVVVEASGG
jgi:hypothetical protein